MQPRDNGYNMWYLAPGQLGTLEGKGSTAAGYRLSPLFSLPDMGHQAS